MNKKLKLQDFTFLINIIKDQDNWNIQDLADKLTVDLDTLLYMLNIMSEVYSVNGESFINFDLDLSNATKSQLREAFRGFGTKEGVIVKCESFFIQAAKYSEIKVSSHILARRHNSNSSDKHKLSLIHI